jgi:hypothetical protein
MHALFQLGETQGQRSGDVPRPLCTSPRRLAIDQESPDPGEGDIQAAEIPNELNAIARLRRIQVQSATRTVTCLDKAQALIVPDRPKGDTRPPRDLTNFEELSRLFSRSYGRHLR